MRVTLSHVLKELRRRIDSSQNLVAEVRNLGMSKIKVEIIAELAFLRIFMAWENFLEESFIRYAIGAESPSGYKPTKLVNPQNMAHALNLICSGRDYVSWNSASEVVSRSDIFFKDGEPYKNILEGVAGNLNDMNTIRNGIAHKSPISRKKFHDFVRIRTRFGHGIRGITPGRFLLRFMSPTPQTTFLGHYVAIIGAASRMVIR